VHSAPLRVINCHWCTVRQWVASSDGLISLSGNPPRRCCYCYVILLMFCCIVAIQSVAIPPLFLHSPLPHVLIYLLVFFTFIFFLSYSLYLFSCFSIPSHSTRIVPFPIQTGCRRRRLNGFRYFLFVLIFARKCKHFALSLDRRRWTTTFGFYGLKKRHTFGLQ